MSFRKAAALLGAFLLGTYIFFEYARPEDAAGNGALPGREATYSLQAEDETVEAAKSTGPVEPPDSAAFAGVQASPDFKTAASGEGIAADDSYFDDAVFIGDSLTEGFQTLGGITNATYYGFKNLNVKDVFEKDLVPSGAGKITVAEALQQTAYGKYYIMLGANELGWVYPQVFVDKYSDLIELIRTANPHAVIYLQSVFPVTQEVSDTNPYYSNSRIDEYDQLICQLAEDASAIFLNVREAVETDSHILPDDAATDGIHLNKTYCRLWADYLREHQYQQSNEQEVFPCN